MLDRPKRGPVEGSGVGEVCHFRGCRRCPTQDSASGKNCTQQLGLRIEPRSQLRLWRVAAAEQSTDQHRSQPVVLLRAVASTRKLRARSPKRSLTASQKGQAE